MIAAKRVLRERFSASSPESNAICSVYSRKRASEKTEIGFVTLAPERQRHERMADQMRQPRANRGVDERNPEKEARHGYMRPGRVKLAESIQSRMAKETSELRFEIRRIEKE